MCIFSWTARLWKMRINSSVTEIISISVFYFNTEFIYSICRAGTLVTLLVWRSPASRSSATSGPTSPAWTSSTTWPSRSRPPSPTSSPWWTTSPCSRRPASKSQLQIFAGALQCCVVIVSLSPCKVVLLQLYKYGQSVSRTPCAWAEPGEPTDNYNPAPSFMEN